MMRSPRVDFGQLSCQGGDDNPPSAPLEIGKASAGVPAAYAVKGQVHRMALLPQLPERLGQILPGGDDDPVSPQGADGLCLFL